MDQLEQSIAVLVKQLQHGVEVVGPEVIRQVVLYHRMIHTLGVVVLLAVVILLCYLTRRLHRQVEKQLHDCSPDSDWQYVNPIWEYVAAVDALLAGVFFIIELVNALAWWLAPYQEILHWTTDLIK